MARFERSLRLLVICTCLNHFSEGAAPYFTPSANSISFDEGTAAGTFFQKYTATDGDGDTLAYSLEAKATTWLRINGSTGIITIIKTLDREAMNNGDFHFKVVATDTGGAKGELRVFLTVNDVNDNAPVFQNLPSRINMSESIRVANIVFTVTATDADATVNKVITYEITTGNEEGKFSIDGADAIITLAKSLDYDHGKRLYILNITAKNLHGSPRLATSSILTIDVIDADDLPANFSQSLYEVRIDEDSPEGYMVEQVFAKDMDSFNAPVNYTIYSASDPESQFRINDDTGVITVAKKLKRGTFSLIVTATSTLHYPAFTLVKVSVGPMPNKTFTASVLEGEPNVAVFDMTELLAYFNVSSSYGNFSILGSAGNLFVIDGTTKWLKVGAQPLDRETSEQYKLDIALVKNGLYKGFATIIVVVLDVNDERPIFQGSHPYNLTVREDEDVSSILLKISADDTDAGINGTVNYLIIEGDDGSFSINNKTGDLSLVKRLDRESIDRYVLTVMALDEGSPSLNSTTTVTIHVRDENDNSPVLNPTTISATISEGVSIGTQITDINASDADAGDNGRISYEIESGSNGKFAIDPVSGIITTREGLSHKQYAIVVIAYDNGVSKRSARGFVTIYVTTVEVNSNKPVFPLDTYLGGVFKDTCTSDNYIVNTVTATDPDSGTNGQVTYSIVSGNKESLFYIETTSGSVKTANSFADKENRKFELSIQATDKGSPSKSSDPNAVMDIFVLQHSRSIVLQSGFGQDFILQNFKEFRQDLGELTGGGTVFIKSVRPGTGNASLVTFNAVKNKSEMTYEELKSSIDDKKSEDDPKYKKWRIDGYGAPEQPKTGARMEIYAGISGVVGAMITLSVLIGVGGIVMIIIMWRKKRQVRSSKKQSRVTFNDKPLYIDPVRPSNSRRVEPAQEAQEVIVHMDDETSSYESEGEQRDSDVLNYINNAYEHEGANDLDNNCDYQNEEGEITNFETFFPPPPTVPPPPVPDSDVDSTSFDNAEDISVDTSDDANDFDDTGTERTYIPPDEITGEVDVDLEHEPSRTHRDGSPTYSVTDSTAKLVEPQSYRERLLRDPFFAFGRRQISTDEKTTEL